MRKKNSNGKKGTGKAVAKQDLPSKVCVVCNRPFTWRKKWEDVWEEVTCCSKSCNAKRRAMNKKQNTGGSEDDNASVANMSSRETADSPTELQLDKKSLRKQHKDAVKAQKRERRAKREGTAPELGRKPCDLCQREVDLLIRCTVDETRQFKMVCGKCWPSVSGGVPDGSPHHPHYTYGGLWKNRNANLKKRVGSGPTGGNNNGTPVADDLVRQIEESVSIDEDSTV